MLLLSPSSACVLITAIFQSIHWDLIVGAWVTACIDVHIVCGFCLFVCFFTQVMLVPKHFFFFNAHWYFFSFFWHKMLLVLPPMATVAKSAGMTSMLHEKLYNQIHIAPIYLSVPVILVIPLIHRPLFVNSTYCI